MIISKLSHMCISMTWGFIYYHNPVKLNILDLLYFISHVSVPISGSRLTGLMKYNRCDTDADTAQAGSFLILITAQIVKGQTGKAGPYQKHQHANFG